MTRPALLILFSLLLLALVACGGGNEPEPARVTPQPTTAPMQWQCAPPATPAYGVEATPTPVCVPGATE